MKGRGEAVRSAMRKLFKLRLQYERAASRLLMEKDDKQNSNYGGVSLLSTTCILFPRFNPYVD